MSEFNEAEKQLLIAVGWLRSRYGLMAGFGADTRADAGNLRKFGEVWMGRRMVDWSAAFRSLVASGHLSEEGGVYGLTVKGTAARRALEAFNPLWLYEYDNFFAAAESSAAHALFCERVYGRNLCQHGLADLPQLRALTDALGLKPGEHVLDAGCGLGLITEYLQEQTRADFHGVDLSPEAVARALQRTEAKRDRLSFAVANLNRLDLAPQTFDAVLAIDTLYYVEDLEATLLQLRALLRPRGRLGLFYTHWITDPAAAHELLPHNTPLALLLQKHDLPFQTHDLTAQEADHWRLKLQVLEELRPRFEAEGNLWLFNYRHTEAARYADWDLTKRSRHLYHVRP